MQVQQNVPSDSTSPHISSPLIKGLQDSKQLGFRSPVTSAQKKRLPKFKFNNENLGPEQHNPFSGPTYLPMNFNRGKMSPSPFTPIKIKEEYPFGDCTGNSKDYNMLPRLESPFGKEMPLSPCVYNFTSPGALFMRCQPNNNHGSFQNKAYSPFFDFNIGSPTFATKNVTRLDFNNPNKLILLKSHKDEVSIDHDEHTDNCDDLRDTDNNKQFTFPLTYDEIPFQTAQLKFPVKNSIYGSSMIPSQARTNDTYSNRTTQDSTSRKEARFLSYIDHNDEEDTDTMHPRTPSPNGNTKIKLESINSFSSQPKGFDTAPTKKGMDSGEFSNSQNSTVKVNAGHGEGEEPHDEEEYCNIKIKKKVCCNCKKSRCLKLYCDCFGRGQPCSRECNCLNCLNTEAHVKERQEAMMAVLERNPSAFKPKVDHTDSPEKADDTSDQGRVRHIRGCNCKKSGCQKKYCECYQAGVKCTELCKCEHCKNMDSCCRIKRAQNYSFANFGSDDSLTISLPFSETKALKHYNKQTRKNLEFTVSPKGDSNSYYHSARSQKMLSHPDPGFYTDLPVQKKRKMDPAVTEFTPKRTLVFVKEENRTPEEAEEGQYVMHIQREKKNGVSNFRASYAQTTDKKKKMTKIEETSEYIPSPGRANLSGRRSKRTIKPFSQFNSEEYELRK